MLSQKGVTVRDPQMPKDDYWKEAYANISERQFPEIEDDSVTFPREIHVAYAVCSTECGNRQFIVDGSTQVCEYCGKGMFRTAVRRYVLAADAPTAESTDAP